MTLNNFTPTRTLLAAATLALLAACSTPMPPAAPTNTVATAAPTPAAQPATPATPATPQATPQSQVATVTLPAHLDPKSQVSRERSVYFDFDEYALDSGDNALIETHGKYLAAHPALAIRVEGNTDERGSAEYNLALGQRRAQAVVSALKIYGVKETQLEAVSWGKERPRTGGGDEGAWAQNRRADLQYPQR